MNKHDLADIYNCYRATVCRNANRPYRHLENVEDFKKKNPDKVEILNRLISFFDKFPKIDVVDYFNAPYVVEANSYKEGDIIPLGFYITNKAFVDFKLSISRKETKSQDFSDKDTQTATVKCFGYIIKWGTDNKKNFSGYLCDIVNGITPRWCFDYTEKRINIWVLCGLRLLGLDLNKNMNKYMPESDGYLIFGEGKTPNSITDDAIQTLNYNQKNLLSMLVKKTFEKMEKSVD